jgi:hypothetical protein
VRRSLAVLALASALLGFPVPVRADELILPPETKTICSRNNFFCALMDPDTQVTTVYRRRAGGVQENLWSMPGWFRIAFLSNDGEYLAAGYDGSNLLPLNYRKDEVMLSFYDRGKLIRQVRLNEMVLDFSKLERTGASYQWGAYLGLNQDDHLTVALVDKRWLLFDVKTGRLIK